MPNRIIKESICESVGLSECSVFANELYKRLIVYADDYGRFNADTAIMRARLFPRDYDTISEEDIVSGLSELAGVGKVQFYTPDIFNQGGKKGVYGVLPGWAEHQRVRDSKSKCPEPGDTRVNDWYLRRFVPFDMRVNIIERDGFKCRSCGKFLTSCGESRRFAKLGHGLYHIDHIVPVCQGGRATEENLRLLCPECNLTRKKHFSYKEILNFADNFFAAENRGELRRVAEKRGLNPNPNPIQSESLSESEPAQPRATEGQKKFDAVLQKAVDAWFRYKMERGDKYTPESRAALYDQITLYADKFGAVAVADIISQSMGNNYSGITFDKLAKTLPAKPAAPAAPIFKDLDALYKALDEI